LDLSLTQTPPKWRCDNPKGNSCSRKKDKEPVVFYEVSIVYERWFLVEPNHKRIHEPTVLP